MAKSLLERFRPEPGQPDLRGFEWYYLWEKAQSDEIATLGNYQGEFGGVDFSPKENLFASVGEGSRIHIWDLQTTRTIETLPKGGNGPVQFSPDGKFLVARGNDGVRIWNAEAWRLETVLAKADFPVAFPQDGELLAARIGDQFALWDTANWEKRRLLPGQVKLRHDSSLQSAAVSPDGQTLIFAAHRTIRFWNVTTGEERHPLDIPDGGITPCIAVSADGLLAAAQWNGMVYLFDLATREHLHTFSSHLSWVTAVAFSADGQTLLSASGDRQIVVYDIPSREIRNKLLGHQDEIWALAISPDGSRAVTGSEPDQTLRLWQLGREEGMTRIPRARLIVGFTQDSKQLICATTNGLIRSPLQTKQPIPIAASPPHVLGQIECLTMNAGFFGVRDVEFGFSIWKSSPLEQVTRLGTKPQPLESLAFSPDGALAAGGFADSGVQIWETKNWEPIMQFPQVNGKRGLAFSPDSTLLAAGSSDGAVVLNLPSHTSRRLAEVGDQTVTPVTFSPNGALLAIGTTHNLIHIYRRDGWVRITTLKGHVQNLVDLDFSPDGRTLVSSGDTRIKLWNVDTLQEMFTLHKTKGIAWDAVFSPDGNWLGTSSTRVADVRLWHASRTDERRGERSN